MKNKKIVVSLLAVVLIIAVAGSVFLFLGSNDDNVPVMSYKTTNPYIVDTGALVSAHRSGGGLFRKTPLWLLRIA